MAAINAKRTYLITSTLQRRIFYEQKETIVRRKN